MHPFCRLLLPGVTISISKKGVGSTGRRVRSAAYYRRANNEVHGLRNAVGVASHVEGIEPLGIVLR